MSKEIKGQLKQLKKEGWTVVDGEKAMEEQLADCLRYRLDTCCMVESSTQTSSSYRLGYIAARAKALGTLASRLESQIQSETELALMNRNTDTGASESITQFRNNLQSRSEDALSDAFPVLVLTRELPNGTYEVQVHLAIKYR